MVKADIITIGDEILIGQIVDTNSAWLGAILKEHGIKVRQMLSISDDKTAILDAVSDSFQKADILILTGGLGPTKDDITKNTLCTFFDSKLVLHEESLKEVKAIFAKRKVPMPEVNIHQAELPHNCIPIINKNGTAPGMLFEKDSKILVSMPGVPFEMKAMMENTVIPYIKKTFKTKELVHQVIQTVGIGESALMGLIEEWENELLSEGLQLAYLPSIGQVRLRISHQGENKEELLSRIQYYVDKLHLIIPKFIFTVGEDSLETVIGKLLKDSGNTLSTAESCTGGYIAHLITKVSGSSEYYKGSVISYSNEIKINELGVSVALLNQHGAVSKEVVEQMAIGIRKKYDTDYSIAVSGIAGPTGGTEEKPVGTVWMAVATADKVISELRTFGGNRERNIQLSAVAALNLLRKELVGSRKASKQG